MCRGGRAFPTLGLLIALAASAMAIPAAGAPSNKANKIIFSGGGSGSFAGMPSLFAFQIRCQNGQNGPASGPCSGTMYFFGLGMVQGLGGTFVQTDGVSYRMTVAASDGSANVICTLVTSGTISRGPTNTMNVTCTAPSGSGSSSSAVVVVAGPAQEVEPIP